MNRADKLCILIVVLCSILFYVPLFWIHAHSVGKREMVVVSYKDKEVLHVPLDKNKTYHVMGTLGKVNIEVKDKKVRVEKETSPLHLCSIQGWVSSSNEPIVCLPNHIVVQIEAKSDDHDVDVVIQ